MIILIICIEILGGYQYIEIDNNLIVSYQIFHEDSSERSGVVLFDQKLRKAYRVTEDSEIEEILDLRAITIGRQHNSKKIFLRQDSVAGHYADVYKVTGVMSDYLNGQGEHLIDSEEMIADIDLIDKYVHDEYFRGKLPFIGSTYDESNKYSLKYNAVNIDMEIYSVQSISEKSVPKEYFKEYHTLVNDFLEK